MASKMHPAFDETNARSALEQLACEATESDTNYKLEKFCKEVDWENRVRVVECIKPKTWRLMEVDNQARETDWELVFKIIGAVEETDLPPFTGPIPRDPNRWRQKYIKQGLRIDGLHTPMFNAALKTVKNIHGLFDEHLGPNRIQPLEENECEVLDASNRYLTPRKDSGGAEAIAFGEGVDPKGLLQKLAGNDYVHTDDNQVLYFKRMTTTDGMKTHVTMSPQGVRRGDIVELEVSFVAVPLAGEKVKMLTILRSIALLDRAFRIADSFPTHKPENGGTKVHTIKRKIGYATEESRKAMEVDSLELD